MTANRLRGNRWSRLGPLHYAGIGVLVLVLIVILGFKLLYSDTSSQAMFDRAVERYVGKGYDVEVRELVKKHHDACYKEANWGAFSVEEYFRHLDRRLAAEPSFELLHYKYKDTSSQAMFDRAVKRYVDDGFRPEVRDLIKKHHDACYKEAQAGGFSEKEYFSLLDARVTKEPVFVKLKR